MGSHGKWAAESRLILGGVCSIVAAAHRIGKATVESLPQQSSGHEQALRFCLELFPNS
jgi:hypothetical protein